jgi:chitin disaccharide deacetylase
VTRQLIVNADDFGYSPGVTRGILNTHRRGIVTSTTVMVNIPYAAEAIQQALADAPGLGLGLHLNLTAGQPLMPVDAVRDLVDPSGDFHPREQALARLPAMDPAQLEAEMRAQLSRFIELVGHTPDHLDSHHHAAYASQASVDIMIKLAEECGIGIRRPLPDLPLAAIASAMGYSDQETEAATRGIETLAHKLQSASVPMPNRFIMSFYKATATLGDLLNILIALPDGISEIMCHPAYVDNILAEKSGYVIEREQELAVLTHSSVQELIKSEGIELVTFGTLVR